MKKLEQSLGAGKPLVRTPCRFLVLVVAVLLLAGACGQPRTPPDTSTTNTAITAPAATSIASPEDTSTTATAVTVPAATSIASAEDTGASGPEPGGTSSTQP